jgi:cell division transport system ATP-binding protein
VIIADEPTGNLDIETARQIIVLLRRITESGTAVVMTTHNTSLLQEYPGIVYRCINQRLEDITNDFNHMALYEDEELNDAEEEKKSYYSDKEDLSI